MSLFRRQSVQLAELLHLGLADAAAQALSPGALHAYQVHARYWQRLFGPVAAHEVTTQRLEAWQIEMLQGEIFTRSTIRHKLAFLSRAYRVGIQRGRIGTNPVATLRQVRPSDHRRIFLQEDQIPILYAELSPTDRDIATFFIYTGLRRGEGFALRPRDINWSQRELTVARSKSGRPRTISIHPGLVPVLESLCGPRWVLPGVDNRNKAALNYYRRFVRARERAGMDWLHVHDLRHTAATWLLEAGASLPVIRDFLGHSTCHQSEVYANVSATTIRSAVELVPWRVA